MTKNKPFSLRAAAEQAFNDYPEIQETTMFAHRHKVLKNPSSAFVYKNPDLLHSPLTHDKTTNYFSHMQERQGSFVFHHAMMDDEGLSLEHKFLLTYDRDNPKLDLRNGRAQVETAVFYHELAHIITKAGQENENQDYPVNECAADAYAVLRHIRENNYDLTLPRSLRWFRAAETIEYNDTSHTTVPILAQIIQLAEFSPYRPIARRFLEVIFSDRDLLSVHAHAKTPQAEELRALKEYYRPFMGVLGRLNEDSCYTLAETALSAPDKFSFNIGARAFQPFLDPDGAMMNDQSICFDKKTRGELSRAFITRAQNERMNDLARDIQGDLDHYQRVADNKTQQKRYFQYLKV